MNISFRTKLILAMMTVVIGVAGSILFLMEQERREMTSRLMREQTTEQIKYFFNLQEARLGFIKEQCYKVVNSVRLQARLGENDSDAVDLYHIVDNELLPALGKSKRNLPTLIRIIDKDGKPFRAAGTKLQSVFLGRKNLEEKLSWISKALPHGTNQQVGYLISEAATNAPSALSVVKFLRGRRAGLVLRAESSGMEEFVITKIVDQVTQSYLGSLVIGFPMPDIEVPNAGTMMGILVENQLVMADKSFDPAMQEELNGAVVEKLKTSKSESDSFEITLQGGPFRVLYNHLNPNSGFPKSYQVCLYSRAGEVKSQKDLRLKTLIFAVVGCIGALAFSFILSHGLSVPIHDLVKGTREIAAGNFKTKVQVRSRDDIGQLAASFNDMAVGLEQRETYRNFLNMVTDPRVAQEMIDGKVFLGGEVREVSILFCDIRGFNGKNAAFRSHRNAQRTHDLADENCQGP